MDIVVDGSFVNIHIKVGFGSDTELSGSGYVTYVIGGGYYLSGDRFG